MALERVVKNEAGFGVTAMRSHVSAHSLLHASHRRVNGQNLVPCGGSASLARCFPERAGSGATRAFWPLRVLLATVEWPVSGAPLSVPAIAVAYLVPFSAHWGVSSNAR